MGIDIYLEWDGKENDESVEQGAFGFDTTAGHVGYLRESYHGGPYATKILVREAFEAENCKARIPAAKLRRRLTIPDRSAEGCDGGHFAAQLMAEVLSKLAGKDGAKVEPAFIANGETPKMAVEEAVRVRYKKLYPDTDAEHVEDVVQSFRDFVALAELKEKQTGKPCVIYASY